MKATCSACLAQYTIADEKVPRVGARVRCRKCQAVFTIPPREEVPSALPDSPPVGAASASVPGPLGGPPRTLGEPQPGPEAIQPAPLPTIPPAGEPLTPPPRPAPRPAAPPAPPSAKGVRLSEGRAAMSPIPEGLSPEERARHERARRLARVLASDIAIYNKEKCERGMRDGNLVAVMGYEIKKSWEVYKERVTPELANSTPYFRDALNEMLGEGKKIF
jgi:predicted Zn finger-like uncharacterized protein